VFMCSDVTRYVEMAKTFNDWSCSA